MSARYVVAGAALPRAAWFSLVSQWANAGAVPVEFVKCLGLGELLDRIDGTRPFSAALLDGSLPGLDRDALARVRDRGAVAIVVRDPRSPVDWRTLGAAAVLAPEFDRAELLDALASTSSLVRRADLATPLPLPVDVSPVRGRVVAVVGAPGAGTSTVAMAIAQAFGRTPGWSGTTLLADFCLAAEQSMLHDTRQVAPGLQELVEAHRSASLAPEQLRELCFEITGRGYDLLLGLRRRRLWHTIRPEACARALESASAAYGAVILDADADVEGEEESGSIDVEERNVLARTAVRSAHEVVAVGQASLKGLHSLARVIADLRGFGVVGSHIHPVLNVAPPRSRARAGYTAALADLCGRADEEDVQPPIFVPFRNVDECLRAVAPLPAAVVEPFGGFVQRLDTSSQPTPHAAGWARLLPGSLTGVRSSV